MKLPRYTAKTPPPRETGLARAQDIGALTRTGGAEFEALTQLGGAMRGAANLGYQAYMHRQALDDQQKIGEITQKAQESEQQGINEIALINLKESRPLPNDPDYYRGDKIPDSQTWSKQVVEVYDGHKERIESLAAAIRNPKTRQAWINQQLNQSRIDHVARGQYNKYQEFTYLEYARIAAGNGDMELSNKWLDIAEKHGLIGPKKVAKAKIENIKENIRGMYRAEDFNRATKTLEASSLSNKDKEIIEGEIKDEKNQMITSLENSINSELVRIDNTPDMTQARFNLQAESLKNMILIANIDGTKKKKMLSDLEKWRRGTNEIDYAKVLSLNQEMDAAQRSGIVDPTIEARITRANLEGSFGGRYKGGQKIYGDMIRRFSKLRFDERLQAIAPIVQRFEAANTKLDPRLVFLFHLAKNKILADNPDMSIKDTFIRINGLAEVYDIMSETEIVEKMNLPTITNQTEYDDLPKGTRYMDINGDIGTK
ncbi:MAG: hypothetical protein ACYSSI_00010 [Planctomycetota bacterium]|jgi:hypothetical protein